MSYELWALSSRVVTVRVSASVRFRPMRMWAQLDFFHGVREAPQPPPTPQGQPNSRSFRHRSECLAYNQSPSRSVGSSSGCEPAIPLHLGVCPSGDSLSSGGDEGQASFFLLDNATQCQDTLWRTARHGVAPRLKIFNLVRAGVRSCKRPYARTCGGKRCVR